MWLSLTLSVIVLALWPSAARAQSAPVSWSQPFHISSRATPFGVQGEFEGKFIVGEDAVEVFVSKATIYVSEHCPYQGRRAVEQLNLSLGVNVGPRGEWKLGSSAEAITVGRVMSPRDEYTLHNLYFKIPRTEAADLSGRWLVVSIQDDALDVPPEKRAKGFAFAHSCREVFHGPGACRERGERKPIN